MVLAYKSKDSKKEKEKKVKRAILQALEDRYNAQISEADATIKIYLENSVGIGEHPQHIDEVDKLIEKIANAEEKLKTAVTGKVKPGSKAAKRRKSYCARSLGQLKRASAKTRNDPNSRIRQARRRWKC